MFAFDVLTPQAMAQALWGTRWSAEANGFWRPGPHLVLEARSTSMLGSR